MVKQNKPKHQPQGNHWRTLIKPQPKDMFALGTRAVLKESK